MDLQTLLIALAAFFIGAPLLLLALYAVAIQAESDTLWEPLRMLCQLATLPALLLDTALNWTVFCVWFLELPQRHPQVPKTEWTLSERLERLAALPNSWRGALARVIARLLNAIAPNHDHVKSVIAYDYPPPPAPDPTEPPPGTLPPMDQGFNSSWRPRR
jgi:hypothetical protein